MRIDPTKTWRKVEARLAREKHPRLRRNLETVLAHMKAESAAELDVDRLVVDEDCIVTEGVMRIAYPGTIVQLLGHAVDDPAAYYLFEARMAVLWPMGEDGLVIGEDTYTGGDGFAGIAQRKLSRADLGLE
jgi:hypothetical protein